MHPTLSTISLAKLKLFHLKAVLPVSQNLYFTLFAGSIRRTPLLQHVPMGLIYSFGVLYTLAFMVNVLGCLLYFTAWAEDREFKGTWLDGNQGTDPENYLTSIYWAVTTVSLLMYFSKLLNVAIAVGLRHIVTC